ncbi:unnamed protein product [Wuchereria bancrofti]|uniref:Nucleotide-diphospho-sugar transferase domain-containing protein n=1 Tax=Wuchereria bancrofti TaxID=6293 RepID=A0A3P7ED41_WUCBA|nr:unnamed protein product [Wuchereria bancrofti]
MHAAQLLDYCPRNSRIDEFVDSAISAAKRSTTSKQLNSDISIRQRINKNIDNSVQSSSSPSSSLSSSSSSPSSSLSSLPSLNSTTINDTSSDNNQTNNTRFGLKNSKNSILLRFSEIFYRLCCYGTYLLWFSIGILAIRKTLNATAAVRYVKEHRHTVSEEVIATSSTFQQLLWSLDHEFSKPPAIFLLNQHALNMTFNFLCNTRDMNGVHERLIFITLDEVAKDVLNEYWPNIRQVYWPTPSANFFVRANNSTVKFFEAVARKLAHWYTPDMGIMIHQCHTWKEPKCSYIPHKIANSWEWMYTNQKNPPYILQLDCETDGGSKLMQLAKFGFYFMNSDNHRICNQTAVDVARKRMEDGKIEVSRTRLSWGRFQFKVYWWIVDRMLSVPILGTMMKPYLPLIGFIVMITI